MPLNQQGLLQIAGPDTTKFLQGQVTCDIRELSNPVTRLGAQCNIKGRMLLCFRALQANSEHIFLRMQRPLITLGLSSLGKYIVFSKAKLLDVSEDYRCIGVVGSQAKQLIQNTFGAEFNHTDEWCTNGQDFIIQLDENRYECWLAAKTAPQIWEQLQSHTVIANENFWNLLNIRAGIGDITTDTYEQFTPQTINFQLVNGINFRKGCYTGQEIVARLHYKATLKRHMYRYGVNLTEAALPSPGSKLINASGKEIGEIVLTALINLHEGELLANVLDDDCTDIFIANTTQKLRLMPLPYAIPIANEAE
jgi:folate-binding protein YgfZ